MSNRTSIDKTELEILRVKAARLDKIREFGKNDNSIVESLWLGQDINGSRIQIILNKNDNSYKYVTFD